jgi:pyruvate, orthophosphate dikinase
MAKHVYFFGGDKTEGDASMKNLLGGKGANLAEMSNLGIPVPAGFTITTELCTQFYKNNEQYPEELNDEVEENLKHIEDVMGAQFGSVENPLLLSIRSGARVSMPGMMDTVLNLGLNDETVKGLIAKTKNERLGYDSYRRFIQMYGDVVLNVEKDKFEHLLDQKKQEKGVDKDTDLTVDDLKDIVGKFKAVVKEVTGADFPDDPKKQLWGAVGAVFKSWMNDRAITYRSLNKIPAEWGTAVNVQAMVFGNMGETSATGVAFTRDPSTGEKRFFGEYLVNAQGEDVVAGIRTPHPISNEQKEKSGSDLESMEEIMTVVYNQLVEIYKKLENHYRDMQDIEFTVQEGKLYMLQTRTGKRTGFAAVRIAAEMEEEGLISEKEAINRIEPEQLLQLLADLFEVEAKKKAIESGRFLAKGLNAGPGAAAGKIAFSAEKAENMASAGEKVVLVRIETSPEDIAGMVAAEGILTARGGMTSHAAVVARGMGKPCVAGCGDLRINYKEKTMAVNGKVLNEGDLISIDGTTGEVIEGDLPTVPSEINQVLVSGTIKKEDSRICQIFSEIMEWAGKYKKLAVRTNSDTPEDSAIARVFGAEGIGLCRTEHMFFEGERIDAVREMILAKDLAGRQKALEKILPMQRDDFKGIFKAMAGLPVTIRFLDPPLHEFLPHTDADIEDLAQKIGVSSEELKDKVDALHESNPMLGHRGCRLGIVYPEISEIQTRAVIEAACELTKEGVEVLPEIMIPLVGHVNELKLQRDIVVRVADQIIAEQKVNLKYLVGTMIELPRAALTADKIAQEAQFFSFGTNDLTQTTFGLSRDDAGKFLPYYIENNILEADPFQTMDRAGVGELVKIAVEKGKSTRPDIKLGICGEHGGDAASIEFCHIVGLNYVSCSPRRVPIAILAAARANLAGKID